MIPLFSKAGYMAGVTIILSSIVRYFIMHPSNFKLSLGLFAGFCFLFGANTYSWRRKTDDNIGKNKYRQEEDWADHSDRIAALERRRKK